jgi:hypothetical protein
MATESEGLPELDRWHRYRPTGVGRATLATLFAGALSTTGLPSLVAATAPDTAELPVLIGSTTRVTVAGKVVVVKL